MNALETKKTMTRLRVTEQDVKKMAHEKLGPETKAVRPEDITAMFAGKMCLEAIEQQVRIGNQIKAFKRQYDELPEPVQAVMDDFKKQYDEYFQKVKKQTTKLVKAHPLAENLLKIKGFTAYQLGVLMASIKDISRFAHPSALMMYSGLSSYDGMALTKGNINRIKEAMWRNEGKEFKGYNTGLQGRLLGVIADCFLRGKGYFYQHYLRMRKRIQEKAVNDGRCELVEGKLLMKGKKNQSLEMYGHRNAIRRMMRTFMHLLYYEWCRIEGIEAREPYAKEYLGHNSIITLEEVLNAGG